MPPGRPNPDAAGCIHDRADQGNRGAWARRQDAMHGFRPAATRAQTAVVGAARRRRRLYARHHPAWQQREHGAIAAQNRCRAERHRRAGAGGAVPADDVHQWRAVQRLCQHGHAWWRHDCSGRRRARCRFRRPAPVGSIRIQRRNFSAARTGAGRAGGPAAAWRVCDQRHRAAADRLWPDHAATPQHQQSGGRARACARCRRIRALLSTDRRYPLRPVARRRGTGALAQA